MRYTNMISTTDGVGWIWVTLTLRSGVTTICFCLLVFPFVDASVNFQMVFALLMSAPAIGRFLIPLSNWSVTPFHDPCANFDRSSLPISALSSRETSFDSSHGLDECLLYYVRVVRRSLPFPSIPPGEDHRSRVGVHFVLVNAW